MLLTYGFSAKKSSGFGEVENELSKGKIVTTLKEWSLAKLSGLENEVNYVRWS